MTLTKKFKCTACNYETDHPGNIMRHMDIMRHTHIEISHTGENQATSELLGSKPPTTQCDPEGESSSESNEPETATQSAPFKCDVCPKSYRHQPSLMRHKSECHTGAKPYKCLTCNKSFAQR